MIERTSLLSRLNTLQVAVFKKRMCQCILATDMARHMADLNDLKALVEEIPSGEPVLPPGLPFEEQERRR